MSTITINDLNSTTSPTRNNNGFTKKNNEKKLLLKNKNYQYQYTKMNVDLSLINDLSNNLNPNDYFNEEILYHYCNLILDKYYNTNNQNDNDNGYSETHQNIALFRNYSSYGPKAKNIDIYLHPFLWKKEWHLAIGFNKYNKILLIDCSNFKISNYNQNNEKDENIDNIENNQNKEIIYPSFPTKTSLRVEQFICFFKRKLSKHSLKYPRLYTDLFEPATPYNSINLLTIVFSFCLDAVSLTRSFCDPEFSPRKFDISDIHPLLDNLNHLFIEELASKEREIEKLAKVKQLEEQRLKEKKLKQEAKDREKQEKRERELERAERVRKLKLLEEKQKLQREKEEREERERKEKERIEKEKLEKERIKRFNELKILEESKRIENERKLKEQKKFDEIQNLEKIKQLEIIKQNEQRGKIKKQKELKELKELNEQELKDKAIKDKIELLNNARKREVDLSPPVEDKNNEFMVDNIAKRQKYMPRTRGTIFTPIEINDLDDADDDDDDDENVDDAEDINDIHIKNETEMSVTPKLKINNKSIAQIKSTTSTSKDKRILKLSLIFEKRIAIAFQKHLQNSELFGGNIKLDLMFEFIQNLVNDPLTNSSLLLNPNSNTNNTYDIKPCLLVNYKRRMKQEFNEERCLEILKKDSLNQIIPLVFENGSIFLINIKTNDKFNCIVKLICVSNRSSRSEREIMKNYAFRRLIELYVGKYKRLIIKIRSSIILVKTPSFYKLAMQSIFAIHHILWKGKFDMMFNPKIEILDNYVAFFENIMKCTVENDMFKAELNFKRLTKHIIGES